MADIKITNLPEATTVSPEDELLMVDVSDTTAGPDGTDKRVVLSTVRDLFGDSLTTTDVVSSNVDTTTGKLLTVGYGGLGGARISKSVFGNNLINVVSDYLKYNGMVIEIATDTAGKPSIASASTAGFAMVNGQSLVFIAGFPSSEVGNCYTATYNGTDIIWNKSYDSGNTNLNVFGGVAAGNSIANGYVRSEFGVRLYLPINSNVNPTSISTVGTFTIRADNRTIESGLVPTSSVVSTLSSNRNAIIEVQTSESMDLPGYVDLITDTEDSKITVNF